jgi:hypothetical protein
VIPSIRSSLLTDLLTAPQRANFSPFELLFGRKPVLPAQLAYDLNPVNWTKKNQENISVSSSMVKAMRFANRQQSKIAAANMARRDVGRADVSFHCGDMAWNMINHIPREKARPNYNTVTAGRT